MAYQRFLQFGGAAQHLPQSDLPTYSDIARCYWKASETEISVKGQVTFVKNELQQVWAKCSNALPLLSSRGIDMKLERFFDGVKKTPFPKKRSKKLLDDLDAVAQKLFDISACTCELPNASCRDPRVHCRSVNCQQIHLVCLCPDERRVPVEERLYLRDQRAKVGTHGGAMQMVGPDRVFNAQHRLGFKKIKHLHVVLIFSN